MTVTTHPVTKKAVKADQQYRVELAKPMTLFGRRLHPGQEITLRGDVLLTHWEAVRHAYPA